MRRLVIGMVCLALVAGFSATVGAVGLQVVGKENCDCSGLVGRGVVPDTANKIHDVLYFPTVMSVLDHVAIEVRTFVEQIGTTEVVEVETPAAKEEVKPSAEKTRTEEKVEKAEKPAKEEKAVKEKTSRTGKKKAATQTKKLGKKPGKVKVPPRAQ